MANTAPGSPSEAMLQMLRKHQQDVHRIASLAAQISVATETGEGILALRGGGTGGGGGSGGVSGSPEHRLADTTRRRPASSTASRMPGSAGSAGPRRQVRAVPASASGAGAGGLSSPSARSPVGRTARGLASPGGGANSLDTKLGGPSPSSSSKRAMFSPSATAANTTRNNNNISSSSSPPTDGKSPEQKQAAMRHAVGDLYQTVQDQRARAENRGLSLNRALYRLSQLLASNRPGNHALGRVKTALSEQDARVTRLTSSLADVRLQAQKDIANMVLSRFFHSMGARCLGSAFFIWKQETRVDESQKEIDAIKASLRAQQRRLLARFLVSLRSGILGKVFVSWHQYVIAGKDADEVLRRVKEEREAHRQRLIKRTLARIKYGQLGRAFQAWGVGVVQRRKRRADMAHAMGRWQFRKRAAAFQTWCENAWDRIRARELMVKVLKRCDNVATAKAVSTWRGHLMRQKRDKIMKERLMMRMSNNLASTSELRSIIGMVMREAVSLIDADRATLFLYDGKKQHLYTLSGLGLETVSKESARGPRTGAAAILDLDDDEDGDDKKLDTITESRSITRASIEGESFLGRKLINVPNAYEDDRFDQDARRNERHAGYKTVQVMCCPVRVDSDNSNPVGVLRVVNNRAFSGPFSSDAEDMIQAFCSQIARAVVGVIAARKEKSVKMERFLLRYQHAHMAQAWQSWLAVYMEARRLRNLHRKALGMFQNRCIGKAMMSWIAFANMRRRQRELTKRIIARLLSNLLHRGFQSWCRFILRVKMTADANDMFGRLQRQRREHQQAVVSRAVRRLTQRAMSAAFQAWRLRWENGRQYRTALKRTMARWTRRTMVRCFDALSEFAHERLRVRRLVRKVLGRVDNYASFRGFAKWRDYVAMQNRAQMEKTRLIGKMAQGLSSLRDVSTLVRLVMQQACDLLDADRATLFVVHDTISKDDIEHRGHAAAGGSQRKIAAKKVKRELYTFAADGVNTQSKDNAAVSFMSENTIRVPCDKGIVGACFTAGTVINITDAYKDKRFNRSVDRKTGYRTKQVLCAPIISDPLQVEPTGGGQVHEDHDFDGTAATSPQKSSRLAVLSTAPTVTGVLQVLNRTGLANAQERGFSPHDEELIEGFSRQISVALNAIIRYTREKEVKLCRFYAKFNNSRMSKAWNTWHALLMAARHRRNTALRAVKFWNSRAKGSAWRTWLSMHLALHRQRELMLRSLQRLARMKMGVGWRSWIVYMYASRAKSDENDALAELKKLREENRKRAMERAVRHMQKGCMSKSFLTWSTKYHAAKRNRIAVARAVMKLQRRNLARAYASIVDHALSRKHQRSLVLRVLGRVDNYALHKAFSKMRAVVNDRRAVQLEKEKLLLAMTNGLADAKHMEQLVLLVMEQARELVDADRASLFLVETADNVASDDGVARTKGDLYTFLAENADPIRIPAGSGLIGVCVDKGEVLNIPDAQRDRRFDRSTDRRTGYHTREVLCVPLRDDSGAVIGGIQVMNRAAPAINKNSDAQEEDGDAAAAAAAAAPALPKGQGPFNDVEESCLVELANQAQIGVQGILKSRREGKWRMHKFAARWANARLSKTWNCWREKVSAARRLKNMTKKSVLMWQRRAQGAALASWIDFTVTRVKKRRFLKRTIARMCKAQLHTGFRSWVIFATAVDSNLSAAQQMVQTSLGAGAQMLRTKTTEEACAVVRNAACQLLTASAATLYLVDKPRMLAWAYVANSTELRRVPFGQGIVGKMAAINIAVTGQEPQDLVHNYADEEDASVLCVGVVDSGSGDISGVLDVRRPRWSAHEPSLPFSEQDELVALRLADAASALISRLQAEDTIATMQARMRQSSLAEEKMASIITWLFEVIGSGDSEEHRAEIEEMRDTFIRAHYGAKQHQEGEEYVASGGFGGEDAIFGGGFSAQDESYASQLYNATLAGDATASPPMMTPAAFQQDSYQIASPAVTPSIRKARAVTPAFAERGGGGGASRMRESDLGKARPHVSWSRSFAEADTDGDGIITPHEFQQWYESQKPDTAGTSASGSDVYLPSRDLGGAKVRVSRRGSVSVTLPGGE